MTKSERIAATCEALGLAGAPVAGFLAPTDWRWSLGSALTAGSLFILGYFGLAKS